MSFALYLFIYLFQNVFSGRHTFTLTLKKSEGEKTSVDVPDKLNDFTILLFVRIYALDNVLHNASCFVKSEFD